MTGGALLWAAFALFAINVVATIERINPAVEADPGLVNVAPYTDAWLVVLRPDNLQGDRREAAC